MKSVILVAAVIVGSVVSGSALAGPASAHVKASQHSKGSRLFKLCASSRTDDILACSVQGEKAAQAHLDKSLREVARYVYDDEGSDRHCAMLKASQQAWLAYRDAQCAFYSEDTGQMTEPNAADCRAAMTEQRARELDGYPANATRDAFEPASPPTCKP